MEQQVLNKWIKDGVIRQIPKKQSQKRILFEFIANEIKNSEEFVGKSHFSEKEITERIKQYYPDYAYVRRYMIDFGILARVDDGSKYWFNLEEE